MTLQEVPCPQPTPTGDEAFTSRALLGNNDSMPPCIIFPCRVEHPRVILRKGHTGLSFYFIFSGSVFVNVEELLLKTGHVMWHTAITLQRGDSFGVSAFKVHIREIKNYVYAGAHQMGSWFTANRKLQIQVDIQIRKMSKYKLSKMTIPFPYVI